jgi:hypothetical protein
MRADKPPPLRSPFDPLLNLVRAQHLDNPHQLGVALVGVPVFNPWTGELRE